MKKIIEIIEIIVVVLVITFILNTYFFTLYKVYGSSMEPAFENGDHLIVKKWGKYTYNDVVVFFEMEDQVFAIKRIAALPGDKIESDGNNIFVDGNQVVSFESEAFSFTLLDDEYYFLGDNHSISKDSKHYGPVRQEFIKGKVIGRVWPIFRRE